MKLQYRIPLAIYSVWCIIAILLCKDGLYQMNIWTLVEILGMIALPLLVRPFFILLRIIFRKNSFKTKDMSDNHTVCVFLSALADTSSKKAIKKHFKQLLEKLPGFAPIFPDICYHLTHYKPAAADIPVASDNPAHYADAIRYNARTPLQGSLLPLTRLVWA